MEVYLPPKEFWEKFEKNLNLLSENVAQLRESTKNGDFSGEHFPEYMSIQVAAKYLRCPVSRIKNMIYIQKILNRHHIDLTTTVYVSRQEIDDLKYNVLAIREKERKNKRK